MSDTPSCFHCGAAIPKGVAIKEDREGRLLAFCCRGCHGAYLLISGAGLEAAYQRRERPKPGRVEEGGDPAYDDNLLWRSVRPAGELGAIDVIIDGVRCASCVWLLEKMIGHLPGVREVRVNYATARARVLFDPRATPPRDIFGRIDALGYHPRPYTETEARLTGERERTDLLLRFGTAFFLTMQLMAYAFALYAGYFQGMEKDMKRYMQLFSLLVTTPVVFYCGAPFLSGAWRSLKNRAPDMDLLISIGALSSYGYSIYASLAGGEVYFETAAMIVTLILAGRLLENAAKRRAAGGVERLLALAPTTARRFNEGTVETVPVEVIKPGDLLLVCAGERFPVDATIYEGVTEVEQSAATGEPLPVLKEAGDRVFGGSTNLTGAVRVTCERRADDSFVARVARLVEEAQGRKAPIQGAADRVVGHFVPLVLLLALATLVGHLAVGSPFADALMTALSVLVIACPCAVGLATPTAIAAGSGAAAAMGVIFKGGDVLERLSSITLAVFDKTGTVTRGCAVLEEIAPAPGTGREEVVALAAAVESGSLHPIGRAVCAYAAEEGILFQAGRALTTVPGQGVKGVVGSEEVAVGSVPFLKGVGVSMTEAEKDIPPGATTIFVARGGRFAGAITLSDKLRHDAPALIGHFRCRGVRTVLLSGDRCKSAEEVAKGLGMDEGAGEHSPEQKAQRIEKWRAAGERVLMVGDGINDAPALAAADVGCAVAGGTDIAIETSDLVLARPDLERLAGAHLTARRTMAVVRQNLIWAFIYNMVGVPLAMTGRLTPVYAAAAMALSSLCVVGNSLRLIGR